MFKTVDEALSWCQRSKADVRFVKTGSTKVEVRIDLKSSMLTGCGETFLEAVENAYEAVQPYRKFHKCDNIECSCFYEYGEPSSYRLSSGDKENKRNDPQVVKEYKPPEPTISELLSTWTPLLVLYGKLNVLPWWAFRQKRFFRHQIEQWWRAS